MPTALNLAQFKISGTLPSLQVNLSDTKYKSLMRLIDVCIPHFGIEKSSTEPVQVVPNTFQLSNTLFTKIDSEYNVDDDEDDDNPAMTQEEQFFEADDGSSTVSFLIVHW